MSTKIYQAYRVPSNRLNDYIDWARHRMLRRVYKRVEGLMGNVCQKLGEIPAHIAPHPEGVRLWKRGKRFEIVKAEILARDARGVLRLRMDIDCGLNIWLRGRYAYIIPIGQRPLLEGLALRPPSYVQDYSYWNNSDEPPDVTRRAWTARGNMWGKINCGGGTSDHNARRLYHDVVDAEGTSSIFHVEYEMVYKQMARWARANR